MSKNKFSIATLTRWQKGLITALTVIVIGIVWYLAGSSGSAQKPVLAASYNPYISAYTSGMVSSQSELRIVLTEAVADSSQIGQRVSSRLFKLSPSVDGKALWVDTRTVAFVPDERLSPDTEYQVTFLLDELLPDVAEEYATFDFSVHTMRQSFTVDVEGLTPYETSDLKRQKLTGIFHTADFAESEHVEKSLLAYQEGKSLTIAWTHDNDGKAHRFTVEEIQRKDKASQVTLAGNGAALRIDKEVDTDVEVPALGDFKLTSSQIVQTPEQHVLLQFSDPLQEQNLDGLIQIEGVTRSLRFIQQGNQISVYPPSRQAGVKTITIAEGIKNILGYKLKDKTTTDLLFEQLKPAVRAVGKGVILPSTDGMVMPFEAVNLKQVDVTVTRIYEKNIAQFFQVNQYGGQRELRRVGRPIARQTISLDNRGVTDFGRWNRFTLDLTDIMQAEPGAIYRVKLSFRKQHAAYLCSETTQEAEQLLTDNEDWDSGSSDDYYDEYDDYEYYPAGYEWEQRDNPCHVSYYTSDKAVEHNLLASDLGLLAKRGKDGQLWAVVTDMKTAQPLSDVAVAVFDYQQRSLARATTDTEGIARIDITAQPYLLVATQGKQKGYLRLDDGSSLSLSNFNVGGQRVQEGIKGYLYGERGVWRPGDSLHLSFMLEDRAQLLPQHHPVVFELSDPQGNVTQRSVATTSVEGLYNFSTKTASDAPTGNWRAQVSVGGATFAKSIKIETIKPNRLKIDLDLGDKLTADDPIIQGDLKVKWLTGAPARNLKASFDVILSRRGTSFKSFEQYTFEDMARTFESTTQTAYEGELDETGEALFTTSLEVNNEVPGMLTATFTGKVFEEGGNFSIDQFSLPYYPYRSFVGVKAPEQKSSRDALPTDKLHTADIVVVNAQRQPVSRDRIDVELYKLGWRWWWDYSDENITNYVGQSHRKPISKSTIRASNGKGQWSFEVKKPDWGRFYIRACDPVSGHCAGEVVYIDWPGYAGRGDREDAGGTTMLMFSSDKEIYNVGEEVTLNIPGGQQGRALISIENGSRILNTYWIDTQAGETSFSFPVTEAMTPNVYAHVSLLQPHAQTSNDLPIRMYGVIPIEINDPKTHLQPVIQLPQELAPQEPATIIITEANGKPMAYTVAVVDEGLLDITRFKTPSPWESFYAKEALGVKTWDLYDYVIGSYGGKLERILAVGGDGELTGEGRRKAQRFKPVVKFLGPFFLDASEQRSHTFMMPNYVGSVRTMVVAGYHGAYGQAQQATPVRQPLMVLGTLPRVLGPDEEVKLPVNVFAMDKAVKDVKVQVTTNELLALTNGTTRSTTFQQIGDQTVTFDLKVKPSIGISTVDITATGNNEKATYNFEIDVRNPNPPVTQVMDKIVKPGETWNTTYQPVGMVGTNQATLEISGMPSINLEKRLHDLINYPHRCLEQTTSGAFPLLFVKDIQELTDHEKAFYEAQIKSAISRMASFVTSEGGFSYWPGRYEINDWSTNYAGHFLLEAQQQGYHVPAGILNNWKKYQLAQTSRWTARADASWSDLTQAYRLYTLALAGSPDKGAMNRLREKPKLTIAARWRLAAAYVLVGQPEAARDIISNIEASVEKYRELSHTYGSDLRDEAMILETLSLLGEQSRGMTLMRKIAKELSEERWMSTHTTAYCLIAVSRFIAGQPQDQEVNVRYQNNKQGEETVVSRLPIVQRTMRPDQGSLQVINQGKGVVYTRVIQQGTPVHGEETMAESGLRVSVVYKDMEDQVVDPTHLAQGTDFVAEVSVFNPGTRGDYQELALTQIFPSGWEIINTRLNDLDKFFAKDVPTYQDIRDDRVYSYFDLSANERKTFKVLLNATYAGRFYLPAVQCEAMYDNTINARQPGKWVEVAEEQ